VRGVTIAGVRDLEDCLLWEEVFDYLNATAPDPPLEPRSPARETGDPSGGREAPPGGRRGAGRGLLGAGVGHDREG
jgi:hypothetical protein